jgi:predicted TIM-barrel fold metal-dependent hydrolase
MVDPLIDIVAQHQGHVYVHSGTPDYSLPFEICELAARHPGVNFIMGHCGNIDVFWSQALATGLRPGLSNVYYEPSHISFLSVVKDFVDQLGAHKVVFASDSPVGSLKLELNKFMQLGIDSESLKRILGGNLQKIIDGNTSLPMN